MKNINKIILILVIILFSCQKEDTSSKEFSFHIKRGVPVILITINDIGGMFLIDSGADLSYVDSRYSEYYKFITYASDKSASGVGGVVDVHHTRKISVKHNDSIISHKFYSANLGNTFKGTGIVGILGSDYFIKHNITIDYNTNKLHRIINE